MKRKRIYYVRREVLATSVHQAMRSSGTIVEVYEGAPNIQPENQPKQIQGFEK